MEALDGNAIGGMLIHVFGGEMTMAQAVCGALRARAARWPSARSISAARASSSAAASATTS